MRLGGGVWGMVLQQNAVARQPGERAQWWEAVEHYQQPQAPLHPAGLASDVLLRCLAEVSSSALGLQCHLGDVESPRLCVRGGRVVFSMHRVKDLASSDRG